MRNFIVCTILAFCYLAIGCKGFAVSLVEHLRSCGTAPMLQVGFDFHEDLTVGKVDQLLDSFN